MPLPVEPMELGPDDRIVCEKRGGWMVRHGNGQRCQCGNETKPDITRATVALRNVVHLLSRIRSGDRRPEVVQAMLHAKKGLGQVDSENL